MIKRYNMKALLINVVEKTITIINIEHTNEIYAHIGNGCTTFCAPVDFPNGDTLFSDDDGLLQDSVYGGFALTGWQHASLSGISNNCSASLCQKHCGSTDHCFFQIFQNK